MLTLPNPRDALVPHSFETAEPDDERPPCKLWLLVIVGISAFLWCLIIWGAVNLWPYVARFLHG